MPTKPLSQPDHMIAMGSAKLAVSRGSTHGARHPESLAWKIRHVVDLTLLCSMIRVCSGRVIPGEACWARGRHHLSGSLSASDDHLRRQGVCRWCATHRTIDEATMLTVRLFVAIRSSTDVVAGDAVDHTDSQPENDW